MAARTSLVPIEQITRAIRVQRSRRVILDAELAALYGVTTERLNQQVRRNHRRFPADFLFQLKAAEFSALILQKCKIKARPRWAPQVATRLYSNTSAPRESDLPLISSLRTNDGAP
jgi:hypothetical protein